jgi:hypothetical protein
MKIRITKAQSWYVNMLDEVLEVIKTPNEIARELFTPSYYEVRKNEWTTDKVLEEDCEIVVEKVESIIDCKPKKSKFKSSIKTIIDPICPDNYFIISDKKNIIDIWLKLGSEQRKRKLGYINKSTKCFHIKRNRFKHLHLKTNSYGFNEYILNNLTEADTIELEDEQCRWKVPLQYIKDNSFYLYFKNQGFEKQKFVPLETLNNYKLKKII